jgi:hypothetical protein
MGQCHISGNTDWRRTWSNICNKTVASNLKNPFLSFFNSSFI